MTSIPLPPAYENSETPSEVLAYKLLDAYDDCLNRDDFIRRMQNECPDKTLLDAIWDIIDLLVLGGK